MAPQLNISSLVLSFLSMSLYGPVWLGSARRAVESKVCHLPESGKTPCRLVVAAVRTAAASHKFQMQTPLRRLPQWRHSDIFIFCICFKKIVQQHRLYQNFFKSLKSPISFSALVSFSKDPFALWHFRQMMFCNTRQLISTWLTVCCTQHWLPSKLDWQH